MVSSTSPKNHTPQSGASYGAVIAIAVTSGHFINDAYGAMLTPLAPSIQAKFGISIAAVTLLTSVYSVTSSIFQPLLGILGERIDRRYAAAIGPLITGLGLTFMGYIPWFGALVLLVAIAGFGSGFFHPAGAAYIAHFSPKNRRGLWASLFSAGGTAGLALGPVMAGVGLTKLPIFAALGAVIALITFLITPSSRQLTKTTQDSTPLTKRKKINWSDYTSIFHGPMVQLWGMAVLRSLALSGYTAMLPFILKNRGFGSHELMYALGVHAIASATGGIIGGRISDKVGRTPVLRAAILTSMPLLGLLIISNPNQLWFYPLTFLVAALANASIPVGVVTAQEYAPKQVAVASSIMMGFSWGFAGMLLFLVGALADFTNPTTAALVSMCLLLPSAFMASRLPEPEKAQFE